MVSRRYNTTSGSSLLDSSALLELPGISPLWTEWAAVIPLVCHLATHEHDWELVGRIALTGRFSCSTFPKLGVLSGISRLLERGSDFIDQASSKGRPDWKVWDVQWGGSWPCANGGASAMIVDFALRKHRPKPITMPDKIPPVVQIPAAGYVDRISPVAREQTLAEGGSRPALVLKSFGDTQSTSQSKSLGSSEKVTPRQPSTTSASSTSTTKTKNTSPSKVSTATTLAAGHRRFQTLHLLQFRRKTARPSWLLKHDRFTASPMWAIFGFFFRIVMVSILCLFGLYGTSVILICGAISQIGCREAKAERPPGYLESNEQDNESYMLVALHQNACTWYLFNGDRGVVDCLLNKTMVSIPRSTKQTLLCWVLKCTHITQLLAMTFVAGHKSWDGIALIILMALNHISGWRYSSGNIARRWLEAEGVEVCVNSFNFTGRTILMGAVHALSGSKRPQWMDEILAPFPRRDAWVARLEGLRSKDPCEEVMSNTTGRWSEHDWKSIMLSSELSQCSAELLRATKDTGTLV